MVLKIVGEYFFKTVCIIKVYGWHICGGILQETKHYKEELISVKYFPSSFKLVSC